MEQIFKRGELYDRVWATPMRTLAASVGISDVGLAKICRNANIPVPPRGYWARKSASQAVSIPPLPPRFPGASEGVGGYAMEPDWPRGMDWREKRFEKPVPPAPIFEEGVEALTKRVCALVGKVAYSDSFQATHHLTAKFLSHDEKRRDERGKYRFTHDLPRYEAGPGRRRLLLLNALFMTFQRLGCCVTMCTSQYARNVPEDREITVYVGSRTLRFTLEPKSATKAGGRAEPTGAKLRLSLGMSYPKDEIHCWEDGNGVRLEKMLTEIVVTMLILAENAYREAAFAYPARRAEFNAEIRETKAAFRAEKALAAQLALEKQRRENIDQLFKQASQLNRANQIRTLVENVRHQSATLPGQPAQSSKWASWALSEADRIDPIKNGTIENAISGLDDVVEKALLLAEQVSANDQVGAEIDSDAA